MYIKHVNGKVTAKASRVKNPDDYTKVPDFIEQPSEVYFQDNIVLRKGTLDLTVVGNVIGNIPVGINYAVYYKGTPVKGIVTDGVLEIRSPISGIDVSVVLSGVQYITKEVKMRL